MILFMILAVGFSIFFGAPLLDYCMNWWLEYGKEHARKGEKGEK